MDKLVPLQPRLDEPTAREREILNHIWAGLTSHEIAGRLQIAPKTVESHRANLLRKFRASNSAQLLRLALLEGILEVSSTHSTSSAIVRRTEHPKRVRKLASLK